MRIRYDRGTVVLEADREGEDPAQFPDARWDEALRAWRVPADRHAALIVRFSAGQVRYTDETRTEALDGGWTLPALRGYQHEALASWIAAGRRGVVALPTGAGKTVVALAAIAELGRSTLIVVPTRVLLDQWVRALRAVWPHTVGRLGDGDHQVAPITVATYASAVAWAPRIGDRFGLAIVDEAHHVGAWCPADLFELLIAPARLGLTATPPEPGGALARHVGPVVHALSVDDLAGESLAAYDLVTVPIELARDERIRYREQRGRFAAVYGELARGRPGMSWHEFVRCAARFDHARHALVAWRGYRAIMAYPAGKRDALRALLARHAGARTLVFTSDNTTAYAIARELLVVPITHEIGKVERAGALARFASGDAPVLVSSQVLDEGIDVPEAEVAIVVGGSASARRHVQRIGRVLRPRPGKRARVYELVVGETKEADELERRRAGIGGAS
jgi:superfamily II DNA or RNA helicase